MTHGHRPGVGGRVGTVTCASQLLGEVPDAAKTSTEGHTCSSNNRATSAGLSKSRTTSARQLLLVDVRPAVGKQAPADKGGLAGHWAERPSGPAGPGQGCETGSIASLTWHSWKKGVLAGSLSGQAGTPTAGSRALTRTTWHVRGRAVANCVGRPLRSSRLAARAAGVGACQRAGGGFVGNGLMDGRRAFVVLPRRPGELVVTQPLRGRIARQAGEIAVEQDGVGRPPDGRRPKLFVSFASSICQRSVGSRRPQPGGQKGRGFAHHCTFMPPCHHIAHAGAEGHFAGDGPHRHPAPSAHSAPAACIDPRPRTRRCTKGDPASSARK